MAVVSLYSRSTLESATIDGEPVALTTGREVFGVFDNVIAPNAIGRGPVTFSADQELGLEVFTGDLEIAPGTTRLDLWQQPVPVERFLAQLNQRYALRSILAATAEEGFQVAEQTNTQDGSIELVVTRWA